MLSRGELLERARRVELAVFDVDGVLTDGLLHYTEDGREMKSFCSQDGLGLKHLMKAGVTVAVITGRESPIVTHRMAELGIDHVYQARADKGDTFTHLVSALKLEPGQTLFVGDDLVDLPVMTMAGLAVGVPNGHPRVADFADWITPRAGGRGAARDVCDLLLEARGLLDELVSNYRSP
ncbi:MAG: HAD-IIIA family hydrolase [Xanthomonadales bacterium]|nr:HAD-IIIA family hydrolase [Xanthomonadales bacterium]